MSVLSLADAKAHLNITTDNYDAELQTFVDAAESIIAERCGPLEPVDTTARVLTTGALLLLPTAPVVSVASVTSTDGATVTVGDLTLDKDAGTLAYGDAVTTFAAGVYEIEYTEGREEVPAGLLMAIKEQLRHLWRTQRGAGRVGSDDQQAPGFLVPNAVAEAMAPYQQYRVG